MKMSHDDFEAWIRDRSRACLEQVEIDKLCEGDSDFDSGEYTFRDAGVQAQWEAWQAALESEKMIEERLRYLWNLCAQDSSIPAMVPDEYPDGECWEIVDLSCSGEDMDYEDAIIFRAPTAIEAIDGAIAMFESRTERTDATE